VRVTVGSSTSSSQPAIVSRHGRIGTANRQSAGWKRIASPAPLSTASRLLPCTSSGPSSDMVSEACEPRSHGSTIARASG
jgi:hypothetical protein